MLSESSLQKIEELKTRYQNPQAVVLAALWMWQDEHGWVSNEGMEYVARLLGISTHHVYGVVTFYTMFNKEPVGTHKLEVCTNVSCMLKNSDKILKHIEDRLQIKVGETTPDKRFTLVEAECLGACGYAPMLQCGDEYYENLDEAKVDRLLDDLK
ncbi:MAG: NADH-quinone oxidoreductase subunit NuoE [Ignavibacteriae bacterium]|nr:NADH-quinone oxidoreductase subunit NuoE [Ignavibacteriota bacterium]